MQHSIVEQMRSEGVLHPSGPTGMPRTRVQLPVRLVAEKGVWEALELVESDCERSYPELRMDAEIL